MLSSPVCEASPFLRIRVEPVPHCRLLADDLENELDDCLHPSVVGEVVLDDVHELLQPLLPLRYEVGVRRLEQHLEEAEEWSDLVVVSLVECRQSSAEELCNQVGVLRGVVAVCSSNGPHGTAPLRSSIDTSEERCIRTAEICLVRVDESRERGLSRIKPVWSLSCTANVEVAHAEAHELQQVLVLCWRGRKTLTPSPLQEGLEVRAHLGVPGGWQANIGLLGRSDRAQARHVLVSFAVACTGVAEEEGHASANDGGAEKEVTGLGAERSEPCKELEVLRHVESEVFELVQVRNEQKDEVTKNSEAGALARLGRVRGVVLLELGPVLPEIAFLRIVHGEHGAVEEPDGQLGHVCTFRLEQHLFDDFPVGDLVEEPEAISWVAVQVGLEGAYQPGDEALRLCSLQDREVEPSSELEHLMGSVPNPLRVISVLDSQVEDFVGWPNQIHLCLGLAQGAHGVPD